MSLLSRYSAVNELMMITDVTIRLSRGLARMNIVTIPYPALQ